MLNNWKQTTAASVIPLKIKKKEIESTSEGYRNIYLLSLHYKIFISPMYIKGMLN